MSYSIGVRSGVGQVEPPVLTAPTSPLGLGLWSLAGMAALAWLAAAAIGSGSSARRTRRASSRTGPHVPPLARDVASALRNQGLSAGEARKIASRAAREHPSNFDAAFRAALRLAANQT